MHSNRITEKVKHDYDAIAADFSETRKFPWEEFDVFLKYYKRNANVLDLGCGNGRMLIFLKKYGFKSYTGVDISKNLLLLAKKTFPKEKFIYDDISALLKISGKFDAIFLIASFHHIAPSKQLRTLLRIKKLLEKDGHIFMINWNLQQKKFWGLFFLSLFNFKYGFRGVMVPWKNKIYRYYYAFTKVRLKKLFEKAGLKLLLNEYYTGKCKSNFFFGKNIISIAKIE